MNNPLLEMAREQDNQATWEDDVVGGAVFLSRARILRAAAAVIETTALWLRTGEGSPDAVEADARVHADTGQVSNGFADRAALLAEVKQLYAALESAPRIAELESLPEVVAQLEDERRARDERIAELESALEIERMRLAACSAVALANTPKTAGEARNMQPDYWSASCGDVARLVDSEMALREIIPKLENENQRLREALTHILEYWNRNPNMKAMEDALHHIEDVAVEALKEESK